ncbi:hypothetical protein ACP70R_034017 [Stipagrostis hirtigluma subsp. patula]
MASSSSSSLSSLSRPFLLARQDRQEAAMAAPAASLVASRRGGRKQKQKQDLVMQRWAELVLCCGVDWGCVLQLWNRVVLRKWLNIGSGSGDSDFSADEGGVTSDAETDREDMLGWKHKPSDEERILGGLGASTIGNQMESAPYRLRRHKSETLRSQYIDITELRICVGTWNVGGRSPPSDLDIQEWLDVDGPADIYVLGFQEIVPLNPGNIFGAEDNRPVAVWEHIIRETLNKKCSYKSRFKCHTDPPSPSGFNPSDYVAMDDELFSEPNNDSDGELHPLIEKDTNIVINNSGVHDKTCKTPTPASTERIQKGKDFSRLPSINTYDHSQDLGFEKLRYSPDDSTNQKKLTKVPSHSEKLGMIWPEQPLDMLALHLQDSAKSSTSAKALTSSVSLKSTHVDFDYFAEEDLAHGANIDNRVKMKRQQFVRIISKQMVGIFLSIWVRRSLRKHVQNLRVSTVGVGAMGYIGNKGSISVSMSIHQTHFCFVCCHLTAGEKDGDDLKRNANVEEILRRTVFNPISASNMPKRIYDHERIIWLGDLNYRINLSYERTHELISRQDWDGLFEKDQLKRELSKGRTFDGWVEGVISFPPTYKYEFDSESYVTDETKSSRRTPAWCDRILSYGKGIRLLSYKRGELTLSDHRPVTAVYMAEVEVFRHRKLQRALTFTDAVVENHL